MSIGSGKLKTDQIEQTQGLPDFDPNFQRIDSLVKGQKILSKMG